MVYFVRCHIGWQGVASTKCDRLVGNTRLTIHELVSELP